MLLMQLADPNVTVTVVPAPTSGADGWAIGSSIATIVAAVAGVAAAFATWKAARAASSAARNAARALGLHSRPRVQGGVDMSAQAGDPAVMVLWFSHRLLNDHADVTWTTVEGHQRKATITVAAESFQMQGHRAELTFGQLKITRRSDPAQQGGIDYPIIPIRSIRLTFADHDSGTRWIAEQTLPIGYEHLRPETQFRDDVR